MKIGPPIDKSGLAPVPGSRAADAGAAKAKAAGSAAPSSSTVELSTAASALLRGSQDVQPPTEFDVGKVERISDAISQGRFTVNADVIADKLLANAQELLSRPH